MIWMFNWTRMTRISRIKNADEDMDEEKNNRLGEPEMVYERRTPTYTQHRRKTVDEMVEGIRKEHPRLYAEIPDLRKRLEELENPKPMTKEEINARFDKIEAKIKAGVRGMTLEEFEARMEEEFPELKQIVEQSYAKDFAEVPIPYTRKELEARIAMAEAEIAAGVPGLTSDEVFRNIERDNPWLQKYL